MNSDQIRRLWQTRPVRARGGTVAGVCTGIGRRYRVDPTLVKVAFIVSTLFGGSGLALYVAAWVAFPSSSGQPSAASQDQEPLGRRDRRRRRDLRTLLSHPPTIALIVAVAVIAGILSPNNTWTTGTLLGLVLMLFGWWLLYQHHPEPDPGTSADTLDHAVTAGVSAGVTTGGSMSWIATPAPATAITDTAPIENQASMSAPPRQPPSWDPLGAAPFAWDLPDPTPPPPPPPARRPSGRLSPVTAGTALLTAAAGTALATAGGVHWFTAARIGALTLAVLGAGLVIAALRYRLPDDRRGTALVWLTIPVLLITVAATALPGWKSTPGGVGDRTWRPMTVNDIAPRYSLTAGTASLDLSGLTLDHDRTLTVQVGLGEAKIYVPDSMRVHATCAVSVGEAKCPDGTVGPAEGPLLTLNARTNIGQVDLIRGQAASK